MNTTFKKIISFVCLFITLGVGLSNTGCASGGYKLTRQYARFVNSQNIIIRIVLYIFTSIVFAATLLVDAVVFNTMDFWNGTVSQGTHEFNDGNKKFFVNHQIDTQGYKKSTIDVISIDGKHLQKIVLQQTAQNEIEVLVDGQLRSRITDINSFPMASHFDTSGHLIAHQSVLLGEMLAQK